MRSALSTLEVVRPRRLGDALEALAATGDRRLVPLAGGTDLFVALNAGVVDPPRYLDVLGLDELRGIAVRRDAIVLGALTTFHEIRFHREIRRRLPALAAAAAEIGALQIQHRATLAGNIANASPAGDSLPVLLAYDAIVEARSVRGVRTIAFDQLFTGYRALALEPDELITAVTIPVPPADTFSFFRKVGTRRAQSISKVVLCGTLAADRRKRPSMVRLAYGSVAPVPLRARATEDALLGAVPGATTVARAREALGRDIAPIDDIRSDREYRLRVAGNLLEQFLRAANPRFARD